MLKKYWFLLTYLPLSLSLWSPQVWAKDPPTAGVILQEIENQKPVDEPKKQTPLSVAKPKPETGPKGLSVTVKSFQFVGNTLLTETELNTAVASFLNTPLTFAELQVALVRIAETYNNAGWVARAYFAPQEIDSGIIDVRVMESIMGEVRINDSDVVHIKPKRLQATVATRVKQGERLSSKALDSALRVANELPGIVVSGVLAAGQKPGETDVLLNVKDTAAYSGYVTVDNAGSRFTGEERLLATLSFNSPYSYGEQFNTTFLHSAGTDYGYFSATLPIGYRGLRLGTNVSVLEYDIVSGFSGLEAGGSSTSFGLDASYPLLRSRTRNLSIAAALQETNFENNTALSSSKYSVNALKTTLSGYLFDELGGGGVNQGSINLTTGSAKADDAALNGEGSFFKMRFLFSRQQRLSDRFSLYGALSGQFANGNLTSSEKFTLGGASGVRAYTSSEGSGDTGQMLNLELRTRFPYNLGLTAFIDVGRVQIDKKPVQVVAPAVQPINDYTLQGAGISGSWVSASGINLKLTVASTIGSNKLAEANSANSDAKPDKQQLWLQLSKSF